MVDVMNKCDVDYVCLGNHETNISWTDLQQRARESKFTWLNTNMPDVVLEEGKCAIDFLIFHSTAVISE